MAVKRNAMWVEREYGTEKWPEVEGQIRDLVDSGETRLSRVVAGVQRFKRLHPPGLRRDVVVHGDAHRLAWGVAWDGKYGWLAESVIEACTPETDLVVELGSGWAVNACHVWLRGGPRDARYVAAEYTEAGRRCSDRLSALEPGFDLVSAPFDYYLPVLPDPPAGARHAVVFSSQSIEQIGRVPDALIGCILGLAPRVSVVHVEPVGWQLPRDLRPGAALGSSEEYAVKNDYNRNLWEALSGAAAAGRIVIERVEGEVIGSNPHNAVSLIRWSSP